MSTDDPIFATGIAIYDCVISTALTVRDPQAVGGTTGIVDLVPTRAAPMLVDLIEITALGTTTAGNLRLYLHNGTVWRRWGAEIPVQVRSTVDADDLAWSYTLRDLAVPGRQLIDLPATHKIGIATHIAEAFHVVARGALYS